METSKKFSLIIHGGAGRIADAASYHGSLEKILISGRELLRMNASALDTVETCVKMLEDDPLFNAGKGAVLNEIRQVELDASIMDGRTMDAGAVAAVSRVKNPIVLARKVMEKSGHVLLMGSGAMEFAGKHNTVFEDEEYFITEPRKKQWEIVRADDAVSLDHSDTRSVDSDSMERKLGTVGAVAFDAFGNLAAATSTGGLVDKKYGRVGDSPIIGAGTFADNRTCAVSCTGIGEHMLRMNLAKTVSDFMLIGNLGLEDAAKKSIESFEDRISGIGGFIAVSHEGDITCKYTTPAMIYGSTTEKGEIILGI